MDNNKHQVVCFGEVFWDIFPSKAMPGGAPINVAYHLKKLGNEPILITREGVDDFGKKLFDIMEGYNLTTDYFQLDYKLQTGKAHATKHQNDEVHYAIVYLVSWDNIQWQQEFDSLIPTIKVFVFGTFSARCGSLKNTLYKFLENTSSYKVLDINLRPPHFNRTTIECVLQHTDHLKLNQAELELITGWFTKEETLEDRKQILQDRFQTPSIVVTSGSKGAILNVKGELFEHPGFKVKVVDTIGSGDAFLAAMIDQLLKGKPSSETLTCASALGALVAGYNGACPNYKTSAINDLININTRNQMN
ncbi:MAG: carbohydrate kinase [Ferruginibacter sp.]|nr:carbohydrate kinase [Ferruginibacter sp.]